MSMKLLSKLGGFMCVKSKLFKGLQYVRGPSRRAPELRPLKGCDRGRSAAAAPWRPPADSWAWWRLEPGHGMSRHSDGCACVTFSACQDASMHMLLLGLALSAANASALEFHWPGTVLQSTLSDESIDESIKKQRRQGNSHTHTQHTHEHARTHAHMHMHLHAYAPTNTYTHIARC
eukprot:647396-Pelagomonas_calceolata.AAC.5